MAGRLPLPQESRLFSEKTKKQKKKAKLLMTLGTVGGTPTPPPGEPSLSEEQENALFSLFRKTVEQGSLLSR